ncbi:ribose-phosphate pyrophosphokinase [Candidatus Peregrinibacteria bacterium CG10_big_fil_rev_8_21_14_0_10_49_16]|nr:MAG: ribose-phosphate pyrophosphokinase [Candidatus Peregrinibacteria bacterium CG22_combo_CG10-13_8_21_14_all_49_11]PIR52362.1 MAG: ribose-phosphate pyrophosphokinase [Candidatus Peregrinibacteria bacterium CG10_big_fil_rev_8_21_14_0_10_49_16]
MHLFAGSSHLCLAQHIAEELGISLGQMTRKRFSCGEHYVKFGESIRGKEVYLIQTATRSPNDDLIELCLMCQAAKLSFAQKVHVILPHFPYARQDRVAEPREPISAKLVAHLLEEAGADHMILLDIHSDQIQGFFSIPTDVLYARPIFTEYVHQNKLQDCVIVAPDVGGAKRAKKFANTLNADIAILHKSRPEHHISEVHNIIGSVEGKPCIIFDDMIDTAGTLVAAKSALIDAGATDVYAMATHGIFSGRAIERLTQAHFKEVIITDSIPHEDNLFPHLTVLSIAPLLAEVIRHVERGESVTNIYKTT